MASFMTKVLNTFGLHTEAELNEAWAAARAEGAPGAASGESAREAPGPLSDTSPCGLIYRQAAIDIPQLSCALQTQVKARRLRKSAVFLQKRKSPQRNLNSGSVGF